jgi:hypothetical protein
MKRGAIILLAVVLVLVLLFAVAFNPPKVEAVPSYARQTGLACSGCHYAPPELNPAGRRFKLLGYTDRADETKVIKTEGGKTRAALDLLGSLPLSVMLEASFTSTKSPVPTTQNGSFEFPQDFSLFLSGAWTSHVGSFLQVTYDTQDDHFTSDNTDIRFANTTKLSGKELVYTPAWGYPWIASDSAPTPAVNPIISSLGQDVAGFGGYAMWNSHLYVDGILYRSEHVGGPQPNPGIGAYNIHGVAPYWRVAWQQLTAKTQYELGTYGMHIRSTPNQIVNANGVAGPEDAYTDYAFDTQIDRSVFRKDVVSFRATYIRENADLLASVAQGLTTFGSHHLNTVMANAEYHFGNKYTGTFGWFDTGGTVDPYLYTASPVTGSANGDPRGAGYIGNISYWPWQNLQLAAQYTGYTRFNGGSTNYDGSGRNASANNTVYLDAKFLF